MEIIERRSYQTAIDDGGIVTITGQRFLIKTRDKFGVEHQADFDHDPTDDEILAHISVPEVVTRLRPSALQQRVEGLAELAQAWQALSFAFDRANTGGADAATFTALERSRLAAARDAIRDRIKNYI